MSLSFSCKSLYHGIVYFAIGLPVLSAVTPARADLISRPDVNIVSTDDVHSSAFDEVALIDVSNNDTIEEDGEFVITTPALSEKGASLSVVENKIRYKPASGMKAGDQDSFTYTLTEKNWRLLTSGSLDVLSLDVSALNDNYGSGPAGPFTITDVAGFENTLWDGVVLSAQGSSKASVYRHVIGPDRTVNITACHSGDVPGINVQVTWNLSKTAGIAKGYEASITDVLESPASGNFVSVRSGVDPAWNDGDAARDISLQLNAMAISEFNQLRLALWAQDSESDGIEQDDRLSNTVDINYTLDTRSCSLAKSTAIVSVTLTEAVDSDGDSVTDSVDIDDDNDGILDTLEMKEGVDLDTDGDGIVNRLDLDSDDDGIMDIQESGATNNGINLSVLDSDMNGRIDGAPGNNGLADVLETAADSGVINYVLADSDADTIIDVWDLDSDNDGIADLIEAAGSQLANDQQGWRLVGDVGVDGLVDQLQTTIDNSGYDLNGDGNTALAPDTDADGKADYRDLDSDADNLFDLFEAGGDDKQPADGIIDDFIDGNGDGLDDGIAAVPLPNLDTDNDGVSNFQDTDSDGDGISDKTEGAGDSDGDGIADYLQSNGNIQTGLNGFAGCSTATNNGFDPILLLLLGISFLYILRRRGGNRR